MPDKPMFRLAVLALGLAATTAACAGGKGGASFAGNVAPGAPVSAPSPEDTTSTTALNAAQVVLSPDGLGPLRFGTQAARALAGLTQALGQAEPPTPVPDPACGATRRFQWKNLTVLVNEVSGRSGTTAGLAGWSLSGTGVDLRTDKGIGAGSTVKALRTAYGDSVAFAAGDHGPAFTITTTTGVITGGLDATADRGKVLTLHAGAICG